MGRGLLTAVQNIPTCVGLFMPQLNKTSIVAQRSNGSKVRSTGTSSLTDVHGIDFYNVQNISVLMFNHLFCLCFSRVEAWLQLLPLFSVPSLRNNLMLSSHSQRLKTGFSKMEWYLSFSSLEPHGCIKLTPTYSKPLLKYLQLELHNSLSLDVRPC